MINISIQDLRILNTIYKDESEDTVISLDNTGETDCCRILLNDGDGHFCWLEEFIDPKHAS